MLLLEYGRPPAVVLTAVEAWTLRGTEWALFIGGGGLAGFRSDSLLGGGGRSGLGLACAGELLRAGGGEGVCSV